MLRGRPHGWLYWLIPLVLVGEAWRQFDLRFTDYYLRGANSPYLPPPPAPWNAGDTMWLVLNALLVAAAVWFAWRLRFAEEWVVRPGLVSIWRCGLRRELDRQFTNAQWVLSENWQAELGSMEIQRRAQLELDLGTHKLHVSTDSRRMQHTATLAQYLGAVTGWPVVDAGGRSR